MIDLHMHTTYSDGTESCTTVLKKCQEKNLNYISITDHNTALAYEELEKLDVKSLFTGKIIPGIELNTKALNIPIEILGYGIDYKKMNELVKDVYIPAEERNKIEVKRLYDKCIEAGILLNQNCLDNYKPEMFASIFFHNEITKHEENKKLLSQEYIFHSNSDCEVLIPLYLKYGIEIMCKMLDAEFALVLYNSKDNSIMAARDPMGIRPMFYGYTKKDHKISFASEAGKKRLRSNL